MALLRQTPQTLVIGRVPHQPALSNQCSKNRWTESNGSAPAGDDNLMGKLAELQKSGHLILSQVLLLTKLQLQLM